MKLWYYILIISCFCSCSTSRLLMSNVNPSEINDLQIFEPFSYINLIYKNNYGVYNDSISQKSKQIVTEVISSNKRIPVSGLVSVNDSIVFKKVEKEVEYLCLNSNKNDFSSIIIPPTIDSLLESRGKRFGLITVTTGFTRTRENYTKQIVKGLTVSLFSLGMYYQTPVKSNSTIYTIIVDAQQNNIAFYRKSSLQDYEPLHKVIIESQIEELFDGYFWNRR